MILIINCGTNHLEDIKNHLKSFNCLSRVIGLDEIKGFDFSSFSGIIISGAPTLLTKSDLGKYLELFQFVKKVKIPILGICLGHQLIGLLYGAKVYLGNNINKMETIEIIEKDQIFEGILDKSLFREEHSEYIDLPLDFILLAKSKSCNNEAMKHKEKDIYGVQFHPEVSFEIGKKVLENFVRVCKG
ncbi:MAG: gamma-glutamyl-gamma-aminobutyrate hydrolase family protein [Candidatus Micrarchaeia archaeon]